MSSRAVSPLLRFLRDIAPGDGGGRVPDRTLLERFVAQRDEAAFAALVERYGRLVHGVCRRRLRHEQDAEDAFQATFLVLVRRAASIRKGESVGSWLYGVAYRIAAKLRAGALRRQARQQPLGEVPAKAAAEPQGDLKEALDEEVSRLPARFRAPLVLCYLEGKTTEQAARQLGCARGTVLSRLARARAHLRPRLVRRGLALSGGLTAALLGGSASAAPPARWMKEAVRAMGGCAASARASVLAKGVVLTMKLATIKTVAAVLLALAAVAVGMGLAVRPTRATPLPAAEPGAGRGAARSAVADEVFSKIQQEWQRVLERSKADNPWTDKVSFETPYVDFKEKSKPTAADLQALYDKLAGTLADHKGDRPYLWRAHQVLGYIQYDLGHKDKGLEHYQKALDQYPAKEYDEPSKHSYYQHVANEAAGWIWDTQGVEAAEKFILERFKKAPQFQYFYAAWWQKRYADKGQPARFAPLGGRVVAIYQQKAAEDKEHAEMYRRYRAELKKEVRSEPDVQEKKAGGDARMRYYLLRPRDLPAGAKPRLLLVMPGGYGQAREFLPFVTNLAAELAPDYVVALLSAPQWTAEQAEQVVWPCRGDAIAAARFTTEEFVKAVFDDVKRGGEATTDGAVLFGWSSAGPAVYATALSPQAPHALRYYVLCSIFRRQGLPPLSAAKGKRFYLQHGLEDRLIPVRQAERAEKELSAAGARVHLETFEGGHGFAMGDVYPSVRRALRWLTAPE
jgi:RNA polymerase sigma factor (sigma-70 family)